MTDPSNPSGQSPSNVPPQFIEAFVKDEVEKRIAEFDASIDDRVSQNVEKTYQTKIGARLTRLRWMSAGALFVIAALAIDRMWSDVLFRPAVNTLIGYEISFDERMNSSFEDRFSKHIDAKLPDLFDAQLEEKFLPKLRETFASFFTDQVQDQPFTAAVYNHSEEVSFKKPDNSDIRGCQENLISLPFYADKERHEIVMFLRFIPHANSHDVKFNVTGLLNGETMDRFRKEQNSAEIIVLNEKLSDQLASSPDGLGAIHDFALKIAVEPKGGDQAGLGSLLERLSGLPAEPDAEPEDKCQDIGATVKVLLRVIGDPREKKEL